MEPTESEKLTDEEERAVQRALGMREEEKRESQGDKVIKARDNALAAMKASGRAAKRNDLAAAKQWSDVAKRLGETAERLANMPPPVSSYEELEQARAELAERLAKYAEHDHGRHAWLLRREIWREMVAEAERTGGPMPLPMPPPPPHWSDDLPEDLRRKIGCLID